MTEEKVNQLLKIDGRSKLVDLQKKRQFSIMILSCSLTISCLQKRGFEGAISSYIQN